MATHEDKFWRFLGRPSLPVDGDDLAKVLGRKSLAMLAFLVISRKPAERTRLATMFWPDSEAQAARHNLRQSLVSIRKALGDRAGQLIDANNYNVAFRANNITTDIDRLAEIENGATTSDKELLDLCRGSLLDGFRTGSDDFDILLEEWRQAYLERIVAILRYSLDHPSGFRDRETAEAIKSRLIILSEALPDTQAVNAMGANATIPAASDRAVASRFKLPYIVVLATGLALGAVVFAGAYAIAPSFRQFLRNSFVTKVADVPRIAVRPFSARNRTVMEQNLAGGVTIGITYGLYAITAHDLFVITVPPDTGSDEGIGEMEYAGDLGVRYLISGAVETDGANVRVFVRCLDTDSGVDVWQDRFTRPVTEAFELQDEITLRILSGLDIDLSSAERNRIQYLDDTNNLEAWLLAANGVRNLIKIDPRNLDEALASYQRALALDPNYISARRGLAWHALLQVRFGTSPDPAAAIVEARNQLNVILRHSANDGMGKALEGLLLLLENSWDKSIAAGVEATKLLPGSADVWAVLAHGYTYVGQPKLALDAINRAMELSPGHPDFYSWIKGRALRLVGENNAAIAMLRRTSNPDDQTLVRLVELAAAYSAAGQLDPAQKVANQIKDKYPEFTASNWVLHPAMQDPVQQSLEFELLSKAGL